MPLLASIQKVFRFQKMWIIKPNKVSWNQGCTVFTSPNPNTSSCLKILRSKTKGNGLDWQLLRTTFIVLLVKENLELLRIFQIMMNEVWRQQESLSFSEYLDNIANLIHDKLTWNNSFIQASSSPPLQSFWLGHQEVLLWNEEICQS